MSIDKRLISTGAAPAVCTADTLDIFEDSSCVALYGLNYDASDASGNYDGTPSNVTFNAPGYIDYAAYFNGSSSVITLPSALSDGATIDASCISFWFNVGAEVTSATSNNEVMSFAYSGGSTGKITLGSTSGAIANETFAVSSDVTSQYTYSKTNIPAGWNHAVVQWNSGNTKWDIYVNGVAHTTYTFGTNEQGKFALKFGNRSTFYYEGKLDQVRIFNKELSSSEVTTLYGELACEYTCTTDTNGFPASASSDLVAYYKLDNDATDETGSYNGTASNVTFDGGRYGSAAVFNGSSSVIQASGLNQFFNNWNDASWSAWINTTDTSSQFIVSTSTNEQNYKLLGDTFSNKFKVVVRKSSTVYVGESTTDINDGNWHHIAASYDNSTGAVKGYVDGSEEISFTTGGSSSGTFSVFDFCIGANKQGSTVYNPLDGKIDQVRIYDKALSSTEVSSLYEDEHQCYITVDSTDPFGDSSNISLYEFENNANDSIGSYNGTATGTVSYSTDSVIGTYSIEFSSGHINTGHNFSLANNSFSFSFWFANSATGSTNSYVISTDSAESTNNKLLIGRRDSNGKLNFAFYANDLNSATSVSTDGTWQHWVCTYDASTNARKIYLNGSLDASDTASADYQGTGNVEFGFGIYQAYGKLDQVRIFDTALDGDKVWKLYAEGAKG